MTNTPRRGLFARLAALRTPGQWLALLTGLVGAAAGIYLMTDDAIHSGHWTLEHLLMPPVVLIAIAAGLLTSTAIRDHGWRGVPAALTFAAIFALATYITIYQSAGRMATSAGTQVAAVETHNASIEETRRELRTARDDIKKLEWLIDWEMAGRPRKNGAPSMDGKPTAQADCGTMCKGYRVRKQEEEQKAERLQARLDGFGPRQVAAPKARNAAELAVLVGFNAETAQRVFALVERFMFTLLFELTAIFALHYGFGHRRRATIAANDNVFRTFSAPENQPTPPENGGKPEDAPEPQTAPVVEHPVIAALRAGPVGSNNELARRMNVSPGEASKRVDEVEHLLTIEQDGRAKRIALAG